MQLSQLVPSHPGCIFLVLKYCLEKPSETAASVVIDAHRAVAEKYLCLKCNRMKERKVTLLSNKATLHLSLLFPSFKSRILTGFPSEIFVWKHFGHPRVLNGPLNISKSCRYKNTFSGFVRY